MLSLINRNLIRLQNTKKLSNVMEIRSFWGWLNITFNKLDASRVAEVGPERAAAEWLLRCGASVKWSDSKNWINDYNSLPVDNIKDYKIEEIDATDSAIMHIGFNHLKGLTHLRKFIIKNNGYIDDKAIEMLEFCKDSLQHLEIISCIGVTDKGVISLQQLEKLKFLKLFDLPSVENKENCLNCLKNSLINCEIDWKTSIPKKLFK